MCEQPPSFVIINWQRGQRRAPSRAISAMSASSSLVMIAGFSSRYSWHVLPSCHSTLQLAQKRHLQVAHSTCGNPRVRREESRVRSTIVGHPAGHSQTLRCAIIVVGRAIKAVGRNVVKAFRRHANIPLPCRWYYRHVVIELRLPLSAY